MFYIIVFIFGSIWGSFSNVCIHRMPYNISVVKGRSYCPSCNKQIRWFDNIPLLSFIFLKAKCRHCSAQIDLNYFLVELISALNFVLIFYLFGFSLTTILFFILSICFIIIIFIDMKHFIIPNELTFTLMIIGFLKSFDPNLNQYLFPNFVDSLIGGVIGYTIIWFIIFAYKKLRNREGMGLGDAKLLSAIGFWFGWISIPFILFFSSFVALIFAVPGLLNKSKNLSSQIPFGPYIILGCVMYLLLLEKIIKYLN
ncbi:prepilin peptidase [Candidatus Pelagibacter sp.]|uniref:prepilin peptidase n=1 Tax=Candidatus Pelagibacter sp. TaxID=2024849 RepID=UPI003F871270